MQTQLIELLQRNAQPPPPQQVVSAPRAQDPNDLFDKFWKRGASAFTNTLDYTRIGEWMVQPDKIFKIFECTEQQKVQFAAFMFRSVVETWQRTIEATYTVMEVNVV